MSLQRFIYRPEIKERVASGLKRWLPYVALCAVWALFFWRFAAPSPADRVTYTPGDFTETFGIFRDIAYRSFVAGRFPLWAECLYSGYPFHADPQAAVFYPPIWLVFGILRLQGWGNFPIGALVAEVAFHYLWLSIFLFLFLRSLHLRPAAAVLGALVFTYSGYLTGYPPLQVAVLEVSAWLPLTLLCARRLAESRSGRDLALTALTLALAFLAGHPQTFVYVALLTLVYWAFSARQRGWRFGAFIGGTAALLGLVSALVAVQLLPSLQFIFHSTRASVSFAEASGGFPFEDVLQFIFPGLVSYWQPLYVGILPLALALLTLAYARSKTPETQERRFWAGVAIVSLVLSFGSKGAAYDVAYWLIPGLRLFRGPERLALGVSFALAVLAAFGFHYLLGPLARLDRRALNRLIRFGVGLLLLVFGLLGALKYLTDLNSDSRAGPLLLGHTGRLLSAVGLAFIALYLRAHVPRLRPWLPAIFLSVVVLDLFAANRPLNVTRVYEAYPPTPLLAPVLAETGFFRVQDDFQLAGHASCAYGYRALEGVMPYRIAAYIRFLERVPEVIRLQLLGVRYVVTWRQNLSVGALEPQEVASAPSAPGKPNQTGLTKTFRLAANEPRRAFLAHEVEVTTDDDAVYNRLADPTFDPFVTVILPRAVAAAPGGSDTLQVDLDQPGLVRLQTLSEAPAVLVVSEAYFPGWQVSVDGQSVSLQRADGALLAASVPAGAHVVEFAYRPALLLGSGLLSLVALFITLGLISFPLLRVVRVFSPFRFRSSLD